MGKKKNIKSVSVKPKLNNTEVEAIDILKTTLEKQLENSIEKSKERFIFNERKIENIDHRISMLSDEIVNLTNDIQALGRCVEKDCDYIGVLSDKIDILEKKNNPLSESFEGHLNNVSFKVPEITIKGKTFDISVDDFDNDESIKRVDHADNVNHPSHYTDGKYEVIDFIHQYAPIMDAGNAVKYISRAGKKDEDKYVEDLKKARWYLYSCHELIHSFPGLIQFCTDYRKNYCTFTGKEKINVGDYCKDKKLPFELVKVINYIVLDEYYTAYCEINRYIGFLEELGHEPN